MIVQCLEDGEETGLSTQVEIVICMVQMRSPNGKPGYIGGLS
jgi:hypothetical protein